MKKITISMVFLLVLFLLVGCSTPTEFDQIAATTLPVYEFTSRLCEGTDISVTRLVTESVSCLHDYALNVSQVRAAEAADVVVISGAGLESFMTDILRNSDTIDASKGIACIDDHDHDHDHDHEDGHHHAQDSHIWLSPANAKIMCSNICAGLSAKYPDHTATFEENLKKLHVDLDALQNYADTQLADLSCRELITFHDGFSYMAKSFGLTILRTVEEESGSEASAAELQELISIVKEHNLPAIFTETNGSTAAASVIAKETGVKTCTLNMAMSGDSYFDAMYQNIDTLKEALG